MSKWNQNKVHLCAYAKRRSLNIHPSDQCFKQKLQGKMKRVLYAQYDFPARLNVFEIINLSEIARTVEICVRFQPH